MTITDGTNTYSTQYEDVSAVPVVNGNVDVTIGGNVKSQADSQYLKITSVFIISESDYNTLLFPMINNFAARKYYTPTYILPGKTSAAEIEVTIEGAPEIIDTADRAGTTTYFIKLTMSEVLFGAA
jgi:outer membrane PBP1 activator LpoA protein